MDTRKSLSKGYKLKFNTEKGSNTFVIDNEIGRGGSCIVYDAFFKNNEGLKSYVRIKECYPFALSLERDKSGDLVGNNEAKELLKEEIQEFKESFRNNIDLVDTKHLSNSITRPWEIYEENNTAYIVYVPMEGKTLSEEQPSNLKSRICAVKNVAITMDKIHNKGFLYLDTKPENVFLLDETSNFVQLFDFDSLISIEEISSASIIGRRISYTKGFAALEQELGDFSQIGKHTDVYGVGALLFYMIFGKTPEASDCDSYTIYDYSKSAINENEYRDRLFIGLSNVFHKTLASFYLDRYQDMKDLIKDLDVLETFADKTIPYLLSSHIEHSFMLGRDKEKRELCNWLKSDNQSLFVTGMGGIGKSTLVRNCIADCRDIFSEVVYVNYKNSIKNTICDDNQVYINTISKVDGETKEEYFSRKTRALKDIAKEEKLLFVIDNFLDNPEQDLNDILNLGTKVIFIARNISRENCYVMEISSLLDDSDLLLLFESNLGRKIKKEEIFNLKSIISKVWGHTLSIELIAKQIKASFLTIEDAYDLLETKGMSDIASEKVPLEKDNVLYMDDIEDIIGEVFKKSNLFEEKIGILSGLSLFDAFGIEAQVYKELASLDSFDMVNELSIEGWLIISDARLYLHPVIREVVISWIKEKPSDFVVNIILNLNQKLLDKNNKVYLYYSETALSTCEILSKIKDTDVYRRCQYSLISAMPKDREEYIINKGLALFKNPIGLSGTEVLKLCEKICNIYYEQGLLDKAKRFIGKIKKYIAEYPDENMSYYLMGYYYDICGCFYDTRLAGAYENDNEFSDNKNILFAVNKSIKQYKKHKGYLKWEGLAYQYISKANVLMRSDIRKKHEIKKCLKDASAISEKYVSGDNLLRFRSYMIYARFYANIKLSKKEIMRYLNMASELIKDTFEHPLDIIDEFIVPAANILFDVEENEQAETLLLEGISMCKEQKQVIPYERKKMYLLRCLFDVYAYSGRHSD